MGKRFSRYGKWLVTIVLLVMQVHAWGAYATEQVQARNNTRLSATYAGGYGAVISFARYLQPGKSRYAIRSPVPEGMMLRIPLQTRLTTKYNREGDRFTARVIEPREYKGAIIQGHVAKLDRSGRKTGRTEMALDFDTIKLRNGRSGPFDAQIEKVFATESVKSVDEEGNVESASKTKETEIRTIGGAVLGAIIGGIAGGGEGAAIDAIIGAGAGAGSVYVQGRKDLILEPGTQMMLRITGPHRERAARQREERSKSGGSVAQSPTSPKGFANGDASMTLNSVSLKHQSQNEIDEALAFADAGEWEPVEDLMKYVYTPAQGQ